MFDLLLFLLSDVLLRLCDSTEDRQGYRQGYRQFHFQLSLCTFSTASLRSVGNPRTIDRCFAFTYTHKSH